MTVKELKEKLECLIVDEKEDYTVLIDDSDAVWKIYASDKDKVVYL